MRQVTKEQFKSGEGLANGEFVEILHASGARERKHYYEPVEQVRSLEEMKVEKLKALKAYVNTKKSELEAPYSGVSVGSFEDKRRELFAWMADDTAATPYVDMLSTMDGVVYQTLRLDLLAAIKAKVQLVAELEQFEDVTRSAIKAASSQAELDAIRLE
jgi:hypothetical protein